MDEYILPSASGVTPEVRNLVQVVDGQVQSVIATGSAVSLRSLSAIRVNTSGLTNRVTFQIAGEGMPLITDSAAPFELPKTELLYGHNVITVTAYGGNGRQTSQRFRITVNP